MTGKRAAKRRPRPRRMLITTVGATAALVLSVVGYGLVTETQSGPGATAMVGDAANGEAVILPDAASGTRAPASAPQHGQAPAPVKAIPADDPARGMVYEGLKIAPQGDPCVGVYRVSAAGLCTHGPDAPPKGLDVKASTAPVAATAPTPVLPSHGGDQAPAAAALLKDAPTVVDATSGTVTAAASTQVPGAAAAAGSGSGTAAAGSGTVLCDGDGSAGNRVQVLYVHGPGQDRYGQYLASFQQWAADVDVIYNASAEETGGNRHVRFVTNADCTATVLDVELSATALQEFGATNDALAKLGYNRKDRKYMMFADANVYCGIGTFAGDERPGQDNLSNFGPSYGRTDNGCWSGSTAAHELGHNLGAVNNSAPHSSKAGHCTDEWDIMCYSDAPYYPKMQVLCPDNKHDDRLDCNHDDYYNTDPAPGSYLDTHWNVANNQFLIQGNGGGNPNPTPTPTPTPSPTGGPTATPTPSPSPTPTASPSPSRTTGPTPSPTQGTGPGVTVSQITANSAVLSWPAVNGATGYRILVGGRGIATVDATVVRLVGLRPGTSYAVSVAVKDASGTVGTAGRATGFRTPDSTGPTTSGRRYLLLNGLTGQAADMWGGSTNDGDVLIGYHRHGYANQQWLFDDAGSGALRIRSALSGKCLQIGGDAVAGQYVMQEPCGDSPAQLWQLTAANGGYSVSPQGSDLKLGLSNRWYYGGWLLELQQSNGQGYQDWTLQAVS
ncbi:RICIN domain-containing protein [Kitasatospora sp. NPDC058965]|uniref:RICIN domain-containing protein n=1 Tax=Kitasatospora sp. NPDC058965 TaxID=3346682 RepID=UPI0036975059